MKKIKISVKDYEKLEFTLDEDAAKGDYICINDVNEVDLDSLRKYFQQVLEKEKESIKQEIIAREKNNIINEFKLSPEYANLKQENETLKANFDSKLRIQELNIEKEYTKQISDLRIKINESDLKHNHEKELLNQEIKDLKERKFTKSTKQMGEDFEIFLKNEVDEYFNMVDYIEIEKANKVIDSTKPDFLFKVFDNTKKEFSSIVIEAKTEGETGKSKNQDHFHKLHGDRNKYQGEYAILVTELEPNVEFTIRRIKEYPNMYMVRPEFLNTILSILTTLIRKELELKQEFKDRQINFEDKDKILSEFDDLKESINKQILRIEDRVNDINKQATSIIDSAEKIRGKAREIIETDKRIIVNKVEGFNIGAKVKKIVKLNDNDVCEE